VAELRLLMRLVLVVPLKSFDDFERGVPQWVYMTERIANLIVLYYLKLTWDTAWGPHDG
jgi:hypothetical protein